MKDEKFTKDREDYTGRSWSKSNIERGRPEALVEIKQAFEFMEGSVFADGRQWMMGNEGVSLADIQGWFFLSLFLEVERKGEVC